MQLKAFAATTPRESQPLAQLFKNLDTIETRPVEPSVDLTELIKDLNALAANHSDTALDRESVEIVHKALPLSRREALQPNVWNWLCVAALPEYTWSRWGDKDWPGSHAAAGQMIADEVQTSLVDHYVAVPTLEGIGRNALARLWWAGESLSEDGDYFLAREALSKAQLWVDVFERRLGLDERLAKACIRMLHGHPDSVVMDTCVFINQRVKTTQLETLDRDALEALIAELRDFAIANPRPKKKTKKSG